MENNNYVSMLKEYCEKQKPQKQVSYSFESAGPPSNTVFTATVGINFNLIVIF